MIQSAQLFGHYRRRPPAAVDHEPAGGRRRRGRQTDPRPPPGTIRSAHETLLRMDGIHAHRTSSSHVVRRVRALESDKERNNRA